MPSSKFLVLSLVAALLLQHADASSNCRVSGRYSIADAPTMSAQSRHNHQHKHGSKHSSKHKHSHTVANPPVKVNPATSAKPATTKDSVTTRDSITIKDSVTTTSSATTSNPATAKDSITIKDSISTKDPVSTTGPATTSNRAATSNRATTSKNRAATSNPTKTKNPVTTSAATLPTNVLKNPGFDELDADTGQYDGAPAWFQLLEGEVKAATKTLPAVSGNHFLHFNLVDEGLRGSIMQDVGGIDTSKRYIVSLWLKVTSEHGNYRDGTCELDISLGYQKIDSYNLSTTYLAKSVKKGDGASWIRHSTPEFTIEDASNLLFSLGSACRQGGRDIHVYFDSIVFQESHPATRGGR